MVDAASKIGMMDRAFFVGKSDLIRWLNSEFDLSVSEVEQCASGAIYIQILDKLFPNVAPMHKVKWGARLSHDFLYNYKILQACMDTCRIKRTVDVEKLMKGKYQDNLELLQWMKCLYEKTYSPGTSYNATERRSMGIGPFLDWATPELQGSALHGKGGEGQSGQNIQTTSHQMASHQIQSHQMASHQMASHQMASHHGGSGSRSFKGQTISGTLKKSPAVAHRQHPSNNKIAMVPGDGGFAPQHRAVNSSSSSASKIRPHVTPAITTGGLTTEAADTMKQQLETMSVEREFYWEKLMLLEVLANKAEKQGMDFLKLSLLKRILYHKSLLDMADMENATWEELEASLIETEIK